MIWIVRSTSAKCSLHVYNVATCSELITSNKISQFISFLLICIFGVEICNRSFGHFQMCNFAAHRFSCDETAMWKKVLVSTQNDSHFDLFDLSDIAHTINLLTTKWEKEVLCVVVIKLIIRIVDVKWRTSQKWRITFS